MDKCKKKVYPRGMWSSFHGHQCTKPAWKDGYCKIHHPENVERRQEKSNKRWEEKRNNDPLLVSLKEIERLNFALEPIRKLMKDPEFKWLVDAFADVFKAIQESVRRMEGGG